jgi:uncharacterized protein
VPLVLLKLRERFLHAKRTRGKASGESTASTGDSRSGRMSTLRIAVVIWLDEIVDKLAAKHHVEIYEVEELFANRPKFRFVESGNREGEDVYAASGQTDSGRYLMAYFILKLDGAALPLSARDMTTKERRLHGRK